MLLTICANSAWNLINFRKSLIKHLLQKWQLAAIVPQADAEHEQTLKDIGVQQVHYVPLQRKGMNPLADCAVSIQLLQPLPQAQTRSNAAFYY